LDVSNLTTNICGYRTFYIIKMSHPQDEVQSHSLTDPESFWAKQAEHLHWHKKPSKTLNRTTKKLKSGVSHDHWEWFPEGEISTSYNCIDRHVHAGNGDTVAIIWDSPVTGTIEKITYKQLLHEVETFAGVLRDEGVKKGDVVLMYSSYYQIIHKLTVDCL
jgi:propionyl-CoA synthetase